ncbi:hypothetical protein HQ545_03675 [Candidatus Woesearchaeota archaeon]|nr:hypothetical protein [Candidatus Woesearchaeota archaeon]
MRSGIFRFLSRKNSQETDFIDSDFDIYSDDFEDDGALDRGLSPVELGFMRGFNRFK